jgi:hypothetical protein
MGSATEEMSDRWAALMRDALELSAGLQRAIAIRYNVRG